MLNIRRIYDDTLPANREAIRQVKEILRNRIEWARPQHTETIDEKRKNPFKQRFNTLLLVGEDLSNRVLGLALLMHDPELGFSLLPDTSKPLRMGFARKVLRAMLEGKYAD
jgi:hypothetical protein